MIVQLKIQVTWEDAVDGERYSVTRCAIARAINRTYPQFKNVRVEGSTISLRYEGLRYTWNIPRAAQIGLARFDKFYDKATISNLPAFYLRADEAEIKEVVSNTKEEKAKARIKNQKYLARLKAETSEESVRRRNSSLQRARRARKVPFPVGAEE